MELKKRDEHERSGLEIGQNWWKVILAVIILILAIIILILVIGLIWAGFVWLVTGGWPDWTGFGTKTLWDLLQLLIIPAALAFGARWLDQSARQREIKRNENIALNELRKNFLTKLTCAYFKAKKARRILSGSIEIKNDFHDVCDIQNDKKEISCKVYENQIEKIIDAQLEFESLNNQLAMYLFKWNKIPNKHSEKFIKFLNKHYRIDWIKKENIKNSDDGKTIDIYAEDHSHSISLTLNNEKVSLKIDDGRADKFIAKTEKGKLNIYEKIIKELNHRTIKVSTGKNPLLLTLNDEETKAKLGIDGRTAEFVAVKEEVKKGIDIRIYKETSHIFSDKASSKLIKLTRQIENNLNKKIIDEYKKKPRTDSINLANFPMLSSFICDEFDFDISEPFHECVESISDDILNIYTR